MRRILMICLITIIACGMGFGEIAGESCYIGCATKDQDTIAGAYRFYRQAFIDSRSYESCWKYAKAANNYAVFSGIDPVTKSAILKEAKDAAIAATKLEPGRVEGYYWAAVCLGAWAEKASLPEQLDALNPMLVYIEQAVTIDPSYDFGAPLMVRGQIYAFIPGFPISVGDKLKAKADFEKALAYGRNRNRTLYVFAATLLADLGDWDAAKRLTDEGLNIPLNRNCEVAENADIQKLQTVRSRIR